MINSTLPTAVLDLKKSNALANSKEASNKKAKGKGFGDELVEKQKKLKKKDDDLAPTQQSKSDRQDKTVSKEDKSSAPKKQSSAVDATPADRSKTALEAAAAAAGKVPAAQAVEAQETSELADMMKISGEEAALSDINSADFAKNLNGKISLEGFQMVEPQAIVPETVEASPAETAALEALKNLATSPEAVKGKGDGDLKDMLSKHKEGGDAAQLGLADMLSATPAGVKDNQPTNFAAMLKAQGAEAMENIRQNNVDNIVSQARTILKDGGGEMQVVLTPDGLGTVDLKIAVENGQVNVEIQTQDKHVKKLFDDSIMDIRHALEGHNLRVDTFKVGINENFDAQQQMSQGQFDMMEREFARDFMGQFRDERQGFRNEVMGDRINGPSMNNNKAEGIKPASRPATGNGRLNVIA